MEWIPFIGAIFVLYVAIREFKYSFGHFIKDYNPIMYITPLNLLNGIYHGKLIAILINHL